MIKKKYIMVFALLLILPINVHGFNGTGHRLITLVAYERLDDNTRNEVISAIKKHKRFQSDFIDRMPHKIKEADQATKDKWIFLHAATWPDIVRGFKGANRKEYHHPTWHYINEPLYLSSEDKEFFDGKVPVDLDRDWSPGMHSRKMNILQAIKKSKALLIKDNTSSSDKALYYCWLFHLVGDMHQPLHSMALFSIERFPAGDKGGNSIPILRKNNLHSFWDKTLGTGKSLSGLSRKVKSWLSENRLISIGNLAGKSLDVEDWLQESYDNAYKFVYSEHILEILADHESDPDEKLQPIEISDDYIETAKDVAIERAVQAGYRLAELLKEISEN